MTIALPGAGKTTLVGKIITTLRVSAPDINTTVVCPDDIRDELAGVHMRQAKYDSAANTKVFEIAKERTRVALGMSGIVITDATHLSRRINSSFREEAVRQYRELGARTVAALVLDVPLEVAQARNQARGAEGKGYVMPADIDSMEAYRQQHLVTPNAPGEFDVVILHSQREHDITHPLMDD